MIKDTMIALWNLHMTVRIILKRIYHLYKKCYKYCLVFCLCGKYTNVTHKKAQCTISKVDSLQCNEMFFGTGKALNFADSI